MEKQKLVVILVVAIIAVIAIFYLSNSFNEPAFTGEKFVDIKAQEGTEPYSECKRICEETAGIECFELSQICTQAGAVGLINCNNFLKENPSALDSYPCTYYIGQTMTGAEFYPCSFECR
ncbi:MAG: hypothetical protein ABIJ74_01420 [archaeon]